MPKGVVVIRVKEAQGKNRAGEVVWDPNFTEGFIRAELRFADSTKVVVRPFPPSNSSSTPFHARHIWELS